MLLDDTINGRKMLFRLHPARSTTKIQRWWFFYIYLIVDQIDRYNEDEDMKGKKPWEWQPMNLEITAGHSVSRLPPISDIAGQPTDGLPNMYYHHSHQR